MQKYCFFFELTKYFKNISYLLTIEKTSKHLMSSLLMLQFCYFFLFFEKIGGRERPVAILGDVVVEQARAQGLAHAEVVATLQLQVAEQLDAGPEVQHHAHRLVAVDVGQVLAHQK